MNRQSTSAALKVNPLRSVDFWHRTFESMPLSGKDGLQTYVPNSAIEDIRIPASQVSNDEEIVNNMLGRNVFTRLTSFIQIKEPVDLGQGRFHPVSP